MPAMFTFRPNSKKPWTIPAATRHRQGSVAGLITCVDQSHRINNATNDLDVEDEHDGSEPDDECDGGPDFEPSLGWPQRMMQGADHVGGQDIEVGA